LFKIFCVQNEGFVVVAISTRFVHVKHVKPPRKRLPRGKSGPHSPHPNLLIDAATKSVIPKQKNPKIKAFLDEFRDQIKGKCHWQNVEHGGLKTYLTQKQVKLLTCDVN
jgi:hypothetical protein